MLRFFLLVLGCVLMATCFSQQVDGVGDKDSKTKPSEALLIVSGFGAKINGLGTLRRYFKDAEMPVYVPKYLTRKSIASSKERLHKYMEKHKLKEYESLHVLSFIVGSWTMNQWIIQHGKGNIKTIIYDRSPLQERAPSILLSEMKAINALLFGKITRDFNDTPYAKIEDEQIAIGMMVEVYATNVIRKHQSSTLAMGPLRWDLAQFNQAVRDWVYLPLNHDQMYTQPEKYAQEIFTFIRTGHFSEAMHQVRPVDNPFIKLRKR